MTKSLSEQNGTHKINHIYTTNINTITALNLIELKENIHYDYNLIYE